MDRPKALKNITPIISYNCREAFQSPSGHTVSSMHMDRLVVPENDSISNPASFLI